MPTINQLNAVDKLSVSDLLAVYSQQNGDARKASLGLLLDFIAAQASQSSGGFVKQFAAPNASAQTVQVQDAADSVWLIVTPSATFASGIIQLPAKENCADSQEVLVTYVNGVTGLAVDGNGAQVVGAPITIAANGFFRLRYEAVMGIWYRVG